jgi:hypothetical protein
MAKYDIRKTKKLNFATFGGLSSDSQKGYGANIPSFHSPPRARGFYAFVWPYYEFFLLSGYANMVWKPGSKFTYLRDKDGKVVDDKHPEFEKISNKDNNTWSIRTKKYEVHCKDIPDYDHPRYEEIYKRVKDDWDKNHSHEACWVLVEKPSPRIFEYNGEIWHHLKDHVLPCGILNTKGDWVLSPMDYYRDAFEKEMHGSIKQQLNWGGESNKLPMSTKNAFRGITKDHLEVFIEKL